MDATLRTERGGEVLGADSDASDTPDSPGVLKVVAFAFFPDGYAIYDTVKGMTSGFAELKCRVIVVERQLGLRQTWQRFVRKGLWSGRGRRSDFGEGVCVVRPWGYWLPYGLYMWLGGPERTGRRVQAMLNATGDAKTRGCLIYRNTSAPSTAEAERVIGAFQNGTQRECVDILDSGFSLPPPGKLSRTIVTVSAEACAEVAPDATVLHQGLDPQWLGLCGQRDVQAGTRRVAGFVGNLRLLDCEWLVRCAEMLPQWEIRLIGPEQCSEADRQALRRHPNIKCIGAVHYRQLPAACSGVQVWWLLLKAEEVVHAADPLKLYEAIATGVPVLAPPFPWAQRTPFCLVTTDPEDTVRQSIAVLERASGPDGWPAAAAEAAMAARTWKARAARVLEISGL